MFAKETYISRRNELRRRVKSGVIILPSCGESPMNYPANTFRYRADSSYLYYFGVNMADFFGVIDVEAGTDCIYGNDYTIEDIIWMGPQPTVKDQALEAGVTSTGSIRDLFSVIKNAIAKGRKIHFLPQHRGEMMIFLEQLLGIKVEMQPTHVSEELIRAVVAMREIKTAEELEQISIACDISYDMYMAAMKMCKPGVTEREIAGVMEGIALSQGYGVSFPSIVTQRGEVLHNHDHSGTLEAGKLLLMDTGAEGLMTYGSDYTRTIPVSGRFTSQQRDFYDIEVRSFEAANAMIKPGVAWSKVHLESARVIVEGLKDLGLMKGNVEDAVANGAHALFFPCGLGHQMGLDIHDMEGLGEKYLGYDETHERSTQFGLCYLRMGKELREGHVMTVEPGIYIIPELIYKWEQEHINTNYINFEACRNTIGLGGMRIEHDIVVTADGYKVLGKPLAYKPDDIEEVMNK